MNQKQLAEATGLSRSTICIDVRDGAPTGSAEEFLAWRRIHRAPRSSQNKIKPAPANPDTKLKPSGSIAPGDDWPSRIDRARQTERETHAAYIAALGRGETAQLEKLLGCHGRAIAALSDVERIALESQIAHGELLHFNKAVAIFREFITPLKVALERLPVQARARANPSDPALAEGVLKTEVKSILTRLSGFEKKFK